MIQKFKHLSQIKCEKTASKSYGVAGVSVVASVMAKSAKFFDRINYNLDWIVCGCCVCVVA